MRKALTSAAVIVAAGSFIAAAGAFSVFNDQGTSTGQHQTGTVELQVNDGTANQTLPLTGPCVQHFADLANPDDTQNVGTVNNTSCTTTLTISNVGSLPFELSGSSLTDTNPEGLTCFASTYLSGTAADQVLPPGSQRTVTIRTQLVSHVAGCQGQTDAVTASLVANEAEYQPVTLGSTASPLSVGCLPGYSWVAEGSSFAAPRNGQIRSWSTDAGPSSGTGLALRVLRPLGGNQYRVMGVSPTVTTQAGLNTFTLASPLAALAGDRIALSIVSGNYRCTRAGTGGNGVNVASQIPAAGAVFTTGYRHATYSSNLSAVLS